MKTIGKIKNNKIFREYYGQGFIYKNFKRFEKKSKKICYVPELSTNDGEIPTIENTTTYTYQDFLEIAKGFINENKKVKKYCSKNEVKAKDLAYELFYTVDWQHPESLIDDWEIHDSFTE